jgi:hypothetical protein
MPRKIACWLVSGAAAAGLVWAGWPAAATSLATLIRRIDVIATVVLLGALPWLVRRVFGPAGNGWVARVVRAGGYALVFALVLVKTDVERFEYATLGGHSWLIGVWAGEGLFLVVLAVYVAGLLAVTARRPPIGPAALAIGTAAGLAVGLVMYALPPVGSPLHTADGWLTMVYRAARAFAFVLVLGMVIAAGLAAARRSSGRGSRLPVADFRARQGFAAGVCAGAAAGLLVSVLGTGTVVLLHGELTRLQWALSTAHLAPGSIYQFERSMSDTAAGHLLVLLFFPFLGAGLGAWGGLGAAGRPGQRPGGGGGGGGPGEPPPVPPPPSGGRRLGDVRDPGILGGYLHELPAHALGDEHETPAHPDKIPAGAAG